MRQTFSTFKNISYSKIPPVFIILFFVLFFFWKHLIPINGSFICGYDVAEYFFWFSHFIKEQLLSGNLPLWNPYYYCGHPFIANPQSFVFYPSTLLYIFTPFPWAFNADTILHIFIAAQGIYLLVLLMTKSKSAGVASAVVYSLNGYFMDKIFAGNLTLLHTAALIPWIFYFTEKAFQKKKAKIFYNSRYRLWSSNFRWRTTE